MVVQAHTPVAVTAARVRPALSPATHTGISQGPATQGHHAPESLVATHALRAARQVGCLQVGAPTAVRAVACPRSPIQPWAATGSPNRYNFCRATCVGTWPVQVVSCDRSTLCGWCATKQAISAVGAAAGYRLAVRLQLGPRPHTLVAVRQCLALGLYFSSLHGIKALFLWDALVGVTVELSPPQWLPAMPSPGSELSPLWDRAPTLPWYQGAEGAAEQGSCNVQAANLGICNAGYNTSYCCSAWSADS